MRVELLVLFMEAQDCFAARLLQPTLRLLEPTSRETIRTVKRIFTQCTVYLNVGSWAGH
jgi:hypothetical protein